MSMSTTDQHQAELTATPVVLGGTQVPAGQDLSWPRPAGREMELLRQVVDSGCWGFDGPMEAEFERQFAAYQGAAYGLAVANGTVALQLALESLGVGAGDEVIVPAMTWQATAAAALDINAIPILADVDPGTYCVDPAAVEALITDRTRAIIVVHLYGSLADMDKLLAIGDKHGIPVIEDCAHAHGSRWGDRGTGSMGALGCFSFQLFKTLTAGEGGFITTSDETHREAVYSLRNCGRRRHGALDAHWRPIQSGNYRMTEFQAAILLAQFEKFDAEASLRDANVRWLEARLAELPGVAPMTAPPQRTRISPYQFAFKYREEEWDGLSPHAFRHALAEELGCEVSTTNEPLSAAPLYLPHTKSRYHLSDEHWAAVDPTRFDLPAADRAYREGVILPHAVLLDEASVAAVPQAIASLHAHRHDLSRWAASAQA
jgi:L-glutamine:2-deoxy-scyllo-inosose/3-amino-2,3-dideoxy-scyllo-inosose aminotransferase